MEDGKSAIYQGAIDIGISDGIARCFASELKAEEAAKMLIEQTRDFIL
jgi:hypothetical protein